VATALGLPPLPVVHTRQYRVPLPRPYPDTDIWLSAAFPGGYGWLFPKGTIANLGVGIDKHFQRDTKGPLEALHAALVRQGRVGPEVLARTGGPIPVGGLRRRLVEGRVIFVGDAGGFTHPISGAGIAAAVASGEAAGVAVAAFLEGATGALADYEEEMRDRYQSTLDRAVQRRAALAQAWHTPRASLDETHRRSWIAFDEYFANDLMFLA
jgi:flavin-dependent dehydrogenase